jgi:glycosyltransferase involved in cell wall biosynthesis
VKINPLVSVITPVLNARNFLGGCIESTLGQSYPRVEHVLVDGGSTDGTLDALAKYCSSYPGRVGFITGKDKSAEDAWNKGICAAHGQILGWLGADDAYYSDAIETVVDFFETKPAAAFVFGGCDIVNEHDEIIQQAGDEDFDLNEALNDKCVVPTPSAFFKREVVEKVGLLDTSFTPSDYDYWIRVAKFFHMHRIDKVLSRFRAHAGSIGGSKGAATRYAYVAYKTSRRHGGRIFSRHLLRCLISPVGDCCRPVLGPIYPSVKRLIPWL